MKKLTFSHLRVVGWFALSLAAITVVTTPSAKAVTVTNSNDTGAGSLRQAITDVQAGTATGPVDFAAGVTGTINIASALPTINTNIAISGPGAAVLTVRRSGVGNYRIFNVNAGTVSISGLTIANGNPGATSGGGIQNIGTLTVSDCMFTNNIAGAYGAGIYNVGALNVSNCVFLGNNAKIFTAAQSPTPARAL